MLVPSGNQNQDEPENHCDPESGWRPRTLGQAKVTQVKTDHTRNEMLQSGFGQFGVHGLTSRNDLPEEPEQWQKNQPTSTDHQEGPRCSFFSVVFRWQARPGRRFAFQELDCPRAQPHKRNQGQQPISPMDRPGIAKEKLVDIGGRRYPNFHNRWVAEFQE